MNAEEELRPMIDCVNNLFEFNSKVKIYVIPSETGRKNYYSILGLFANGSVYKGDVQISFPSLYENVATARKVLFEHTKATSVQAYEPRKGIVIC